MNFEEYRAKPLLSAQGISVPHSAIATNPEQAQLKAADIGPCVVKAQVATGKRGKAGGIQLAATPEEAGQHARAILGMDIDGYSVEKLLIEEQVDIASELYLAILNDSVSQSPMLLFSAMGGIDIEEIASTDSSAMKRMVIDIASGINRKQALDLVNQTGVPQADHIADTMVKLYRAYRQNDAELIEINPLVITRAGDIVALDCKFTLDDGASPRQQQLVEHGAQEPMTDIEKKAADAGLKYIELGGTVGILANGAGLTMTSMDTVSYYGGEPANFLEIGGEAYRKGEEALAILLENTRMKSLLINFCGAFARTDVMAKGVIEAWKNINPNIPVFFTIHGTGDVEARELVRNELGIECYDLMDDAVQAAVAAAKGDKS